jgi:class 3 adenylate cyclase
VAICTQCGTDNAADARFCATCGATLAAAEAPARAQLVRKTVTALFADITSSTELGERLDPETLRRLLFRYFDEMRAILERHGGTVEKYAGDAVMAVFGVPVVHEDDALRAVLAAREMHRALERLNVELEDVWGVRLEARIGINTGEVVTSESEAGTVATGDPVNVAARLQQAADPGETLMGKETYRLVEHAIEAGPLHALPVKGKRKPVEPWRLEKVISGAPRVLRQESPLVGRRGERERLEAIFRRTLDERRCRLVALVGAAGIGKSRLAEETAARLPANAAVARGRCRAYGDGITFWPLRDVVRGLAGIGAEDDPEAARAKLARLVAGREDGERIAAAVAGVIGLSETKGRSEDVFWAARKLLETLAEQRPLVLVLEDLHWAEPTFLDLIEYLVAWVRDVPIVLLGLTRPDLLETRPSWVNGSVETEVVALEPLGESDARTLVANLLESDEVSDEVARLIMDAAEGNPLFVEELLRMLLEDGTLGREDSGWMLARDVERLRVPPTINALLAARLDRLPPEERDLVQRAAVVGTHFSWSAVSHLAAPESKSGVGRDLQALVRRRLILPDDGAAVASEDAFRFAHPLVRDAAYVALPKGLRAELHERYAAWVGERRRAVEGEYDEIVGYHLEQAYEARVALGMTDEGTRRLAERAAEALAGAGRRAFASGDMPAAAALARRATVLLAHDDASRLALAPDFAVALMETGDSDQAEGLLEAAARASDPATRAHAQIVLAHLRFRTDPDVAVDDATRVGEQAVATFAALGDDLGLAQAWRLLSLMRRKRGQLGVAAEFLEQALVHAERAGNVAERGAILNHLGVLLYYGPTPVPEAASRCEQIRLGARGDRIVEAGTMLFLAGFHAMQGNFGQGRDLAARSRAVFEDLGVPRYVAAARWYAAEVELLAGNLTSAEPELRAVLETFAAVGDRGSAREVAYQLADTLLAQGATEEAGAVLSEWHGGPRYPSVLTPGVVADTPRAVAAAATHAKLLAASGDTEEAEREARRAVSLGDETDQLNIRGDARVALATVLVGDGRHEEAAATIEEAVALYERKGNLTGAARAAAILEDARATR